MGGGRYEAQLCVVIVEDLFGKVAGAVTETLIREPSHLPMLMHKLKPKFPVVMLRKALAILINFDFVAFTLDAQMKTHYKVKMEQILRFLSGPRCCLVIKKLYGQLAEDICDEIFSQGQLTCSNAMRRAFARDDSVAIDELKRVFCELAVAQFIIRAPPKEDELNGCPMFKSDYDPFLMPEIVLNNIRPESDEKSRKRKNEDDVKDGDEGVYWRLNWKRFEVYFRDELITNYLVAQTSSSTRIENICVKTVQAIFKCNEVRSTSLQALSTAPISLYDILKVLKDNDLDVTKADLEYALRLLCDESGGVLRKSGDSAGGLYIIDIEMAVKQICKGHCESLVREQFEGRAVRVLRLLEQRHNLDEDQVAKLCMMSPKEAKELLYALLEEGYVFIKPVGRANDFQPARTFYVYHTNLSQTIRGLVEYTCKLIRNLIIRDTHEKKEHKTLLDKDATIGPIIEGIKANEELDNESKIAQISEVEDMYLPGPDRAKLSKYRQAQALLLASQDKSASVLFLFRLLLELSKQRNPEK